MLGQIRGLDQARASGNHFSAVMAWPRVSDCREHFWNTYHHRGPGPHAGRDEKGGVGALLKVEGKAPPENGGAPPSHCDMMQKG